MEEFLLKLGLTAGEAKVYLALLKLKTATTGPLVEESRVSKSKVYEILERLVTKGIVGKVTKDGVLHYQATHPSHLLALYEQRKGEMELLKARIKEALPALEALYDAIPERQEVAVFKGFAGIRSVFSDIIACSKEGGEYLVFVAVEPPDQFKPFLRDWSLEKEKKRLKTSLIFNNSTSAQYIREIGREKDTTIKITNKEFTTPAVFNIYGKKTAILLWSKNPLGIIIEDEEITNSYKQYFNLLWSQSIRTTQMNRYHV